MPAGGQRTRHIRYGQPRMEQILACLPKYLAACYRANNRYKCAVSAKSTASKSWHYKTWEGQSNITFWRVCRSERSSISHSKGLEDVSETSLEMPCGSCQGMYLCNNMMCLSGFAGFPLAGRALATLSHVSVSVVRIINRNPVQHSLSLATSCPSQRLICHLFDIMSERVG